MSSSYPSDIMRSPAEVELLLQPSERATMMASWMHTDRNNETDFNQNYPSTMHAVPLATQWSGNYVRQPNVTTATPYGPRPSALSEFFGKQLQAIQNALAGAP